MKHLQILITANIGSLRAYRIDQSSVAHRGKAELIRKIEYEQAHKKLSDQLSDRAGRFRGSGDARSARRSSGERHELINDMKSKAIKQLANDINGIIKLTDAEKIFVAIPKPISAEIKSLLTKPALKKVAKIILADIVKEPIAELRDRFKI